MSLYEKIMNQDAAISLVGLGYVGLPIAIAFSKKVKVIGFDVNAEKIALYKSGVDPTNEAGDEAVKNCTVEFTSNPERLKAARFHIVAVPTPVRADHTPDLTPVERASRMLGKCLTKGSIVVYESTVYPGVTQDICVPILEAESGLTCGKDFFIGYSPERINPGDHEHRLENIVKIVSGMDAGTLDTVAKVYELVVDAGVHRAPSIEVAEAAKVIENSQRDINIAFMNELSIIFDKLGIDTKAVLEAAGTKWNFLNFRPGLVGGHCIGVDPYYLTYRAEQIGYKSQVILSGRDINNSMGKRIVDKLIKELVLSDVVIRKARVGILGFTFKENCPDTRNTRVIDIVKELKEYGVEPIIYDPWADKKEAFLEYALSFQEKTDLQELDAVVVAVAHADFLKLQLEDFEAMYRQDRTRKILMDIKGLYEKEQFDAAGYCYWRL